VWKRRRIDKWHNVTKKKQKQMKYGGVWRNEKHYCCNGAIDNMAKGMA